jgi:hypothetical protein
MCQGGYWCSLNVYAPAKAQRRKEKKAHPESIDSLGAFAPLREILIKLHHYREAGFGRIPLLASKSLGG